MEEGITFAEEVRRRRRGADLTQEQLAEKLGVTREAISQIERGLTQRPKPEILEGLEHHLGLSRVYANQLLGALPLASHGNISFELDRIAAIPDEDQRIAALLALPPDMYEKLLLLAQDIQRAAIRQLREQAGQNRARAR